MRPLIYHIPSRQYPLPSIKHNEGYVIAQLQAHSPLDHRVASSNGAQGSAYSGISFSELRTLAAHKPVTLVHHEDSPIPQSSPLFVSEAIHDVPGVRRVLVRYGPSIESLSSSRQTESQWDSTIIVEGNNDSGRSDCSVLKLGAPIRTVRHRKIAMGGILGIGCYDLADSKLARDVARAWLSKDERSMVLIDYSPEVFAYERSNLRSEFGNDYCVRLHPVVDLSAQPSFSIDAQGSIPYSAISLASQVDAVVGLSNHIHHSTLLALGQGAPIIAPARVYGEVLDQENAVFFDESRPLQSILDALEHFDPDSFDSSRIQQKLQNQGRTVQSMVANLDLILG